MNTMNAAGAARIEGRHRSGDPCRPRYGMLGPLVVQRGGRQDEVMGRRPQTVLVCLLLARGRSVSDQRLIDALYGGRPASSARNQIQQAVSALRRLGVPIARVDGGYILPVADLPMVFVHSKDVEVAQNKLSPIDTQVSDYEWAK